MATLKNVEVISHKKEIIDLKNEAVARALEAIGIQAEGDVVKIVAEKRIIDTGRLMGSITYKTAKGGDSVRPPAKSGDEVPGTPDKDSVYIGTNVEYAAIHEYGTSRIVARPYLKPGIMNNLSTYKEIAKKMLSS